MTSFRSSLDKSSLQPPRTVIRLRSPDQPADQGLSSLGLIMALAGSVMAPLMGAFALMQVWVSASKAEAAAVFGQHVDNSATFWWFVLGAAAVGRSFVHRIAGIQLWRDVPTGTPAMRGIDQYAMAALVHTGLWMYFLHARFHLATGPLIGAAAVLMAWPASVWAITRLPRFAALGDRPPAAEDNGFEGLAVLMAILGFTGLCAAAVMLVVGWQARSQDLTWTSNIILLAGGFLAVRSYVQTTVGVRALRGGAVGATDEFLRYGNLGVTIGAGVGGVFMLWLFISSMSALAAAAGCGLMLSLMAWPAIVRRFVSWRHLSDVVNDTVRRRSPDAGITALGWLLLASAVSGLAATLMAELWGTSHGDGFSPLQLLQMFGVPLSSTTDWYAAPLHGLELWAALELLAVTPRRRWVATGWALLALAVVAFDVAPHLPLHHGALRDRAIMWITVLLASTPAAATLLLVHRKLIPQAVARVRTADPR